MSPRNSSFGRLMIAGALTLAVLGAAPSVTFAKSKPKTKLSAKQAEAVALKAHPKGKIAGKTDLETEDGKVQYEVVVREGKKLLEVNVDANSGKINSTEVTSAAEEAKEKSEKEKPAKEKGK